MQWEYSGANNLARTTRCTASEDNVRHRLNRSRNPWSFDHIALERAQLADSVMRKDHYYDSRLWYPTAHCSCRPRRRENAEMYLSRRQSPPDVVRTSRIAWSHSLPSNIWTTFKLSLMQYQISTLNSWIILSVFAGSQISQHQINTVQSLARFLGWHVVSSSAHLGLGPVEPLGNASSCMLSSPSGNKWVDLTFSSQHPMLYIQFDTLMCCLFLFEMIIFHWIGLIT